MQEMDILAADAPTSGVTSSPIRLWFTAPNLGHPLIDDNHDRPLHPPVGPFLREYLSRYEVSVAFSVSDSRLHICLKSSSCHNVFILLSLSGVTTLGLLVGVCAACMQAYT